MMIYILTLRNNYIVYFARPYSISICIVNMYWSVSGVYCSWLPNRQTLYP